MKTNEDGTITLEVGDVLFADSHYSGLKKVTIERVTKTQAIFGNTRLRQNGRTSFEEFGASGYGRTYYRPVTPELEAKFHEQVLRTKFNNFIRQSDKFPLPIVAQLVQILETAKNNGTL